MVVVEYRLALKEKGFDIGRYQARNLMQKAEVVAVHPKQRNVYPATLGEESRIAENHLNREFQSTRPRGTRLRMLNRLNLITKSPINCDPIRTYTVIIIIYS